MTYKLTLIKKGQGMKVLAINSNYSTPNQNYKKENVNFEAVRVIGPDAIKRFEDIAPAKSLTQHLIYWATKGPMGKKIEAVVRAITGIADDVPISKVYDVKISSYADETKMQSDLFLFSDTIKRDTEFDTLQTQVQKAIKEASDELTNRPDTIPEEQLAGLDAKARSQLVAKLQNEAQVNYFDELLDTEGTECWKLGQMIKGFMADADKEGHQVTNDEIIPFARQLEANKTACGRAIEAARNAKDTADNAVNNEIIAKWFAPKPAAEVKPEAES